VAGAKYIYGVINANNKKKFVPVEEAKTGEVYSICYQDIASVVSDYPESFFGYGTREEVAKKLVSHQTVIEEVMKEYAIIPFKFGTLLENDDEVKKVLESGYFEFKDWLREMDKKIELDVVALWNDFNSVIKKIGEEKEDIRNFIQEVAKKPPKETFQDRVKIGCMIKDVCDKKREVLQKEMLEFLREKAKIENFKKHEIMDDKMILNYAFLLDKDKEKEFDQALGELNKHYSERINFKCVGPLPLYSFSTYEVKKVDYEAIEKARKLLGLAEEISASNVKEAYRRLVQEKHPDKLPDDSDSSRMFEEIQSAYKLLLDYCGTEKKSLIRENVQGTYTVSVFDIEKEM